MSKAPIHLLTDVITIERPIVATRNGRAKPTAWCTRLVAIAARVTPLLTSHTGRLTGRPARRFRIFTKRKHEVSSGDRIKVRCGPHLIVTDVWDLGPEMNVQMLITEEWVT